ncbi:unnamed protein product [Gongylonema pulchrum]|uniref:Uncharacterized protein n=1 Tax=Gongylonema pulchrum TaxID=637853 RepID=A0A3P7NLX0_9BILA|nr:unnamed protein product [Gongylonema pulchrum]
MAHDELRKLNEQIKKTTAALLALPVPTYQKEHDDYLEAIRNSQKEQKAIVELAVERQRKALVNEASATASSDVVLNSPDISNTTEVNLD